MAVAVPVGQSSDIEVHEQLLALRRHIEMLQAEEAALFARWDASSIWSDNGSKSSAHRYARETGISIAEGKKIKTRARKLLTMPHTMLAFATGELTTGRVDMLVRTNQDRVAVLFARDEAMLVDNVKRLSFKDAQRFLEYWLLHADPDGAEDQAKNSFDSRNAFTGRTFENCVDIRALLDPVGGEIFLDELERLEKQLFEEDWAEAKARVDCPVYSNDLRRTPAQRRADALVLMATRSASPAGGSNRPLFTVVLGKDSVQRLSELGSGAVIAPGLLLPYLDDALFERVVFDSKSRVTDVSHKRSFVGAVRRSLEVRDRYCQHPSGCDVPAAQCEGDHIQPWSRGGVTTLWNGQLYCAFHNRAKGSGPP